MKRTYLLAVLAVFLAAPGPSWASSCEEQVREVEREAIANGVAPLTRAERQFAIAQCQRFGSAVDRR